jgi:hypothetical protein
MAVFILRCDDNIWVGGGGRLRQRREATCVTTLPFGPSKQIEPQSGNKCIVYATVLPLPSPALPPSVFQRCIVALLMCERCVHFE